MTWFILKVYLFKYYIISWDKVLYYLLRLILEWNAINSLAMASISWQNYALKNEMFHVLDSNKCRKYIDISYCFILTIKRNNYRTASKCNYDIKYDKTQYIFMIIGNKKYWNNVPERFYNLHAVANRYHISLALNSQIVQLRNIICLFINIEIKALKSEQNKILFSEYDRKSN